MQVKGFYQGLIGIALILLGGCAGPKNIPLPDSFWQEKQSITVASYQAPKSEMHYIGDQALLELAVNHVMTKSLDNYLKRVDLNWYTELAQNFIDRLEKCHMDVTAYPKKLDGNKSYKLALAQTSGGKLLTLELVALGARREYFSCIPKGAPTAYCVLKGTLTDPKSGKPCWYYEAEIIQPVQGKWDQPPTYPNFAQALRLAIDEAREEVLDSFFGGR